jgi:hypothetical protein
MENVAFHSPQSPPVRWTVWRTDDNGNTFVVRDRLERADAERLVVELTARGHKQTYWAAEEARRDF